MWPVWVFLVIFYADAAHYSSHNPIPPNKNDVYRMICVYLSGIICVLHLMNNYSPISTNENKTAFLFIFATFAFLQLSRCILDKLEIEANRNIYNFRSVFRDIQILFCYGIFLLVVFSALSSPSNSVLYFLSIYFCASAISLQLKYRFWDDIVRRKTHRGEPYSGTSNASSGGVVFALIQGLWNVTLRAFIIITYSFGLIFSLLQSRSGWLSQAHFSINPDIFSNLDVTDFLYFSVITITTVGFGDLSPVSKLAQFICAIEIVIGYFFLGLLFARVTQTFFIHEDS